jgi:hypothetical protein
MKVKSQATIKKNFEQSTSIVTERYRSGVSDANWKDPALAGQDLYVQTMQNPSILARRNKGINKVSDESWRVSATTKGAPVIAQRMKDASGAQASGFEPYRSALEGMTLPAKTTDPAQNVANRVTPIAVRFRQIKDAEG